MHFNFKGQFIILLLVIILVVYKFVIPYAKHLMLHFDSKSLYNEFKQSELPWQVYNKTEQDRDIYFIEIGKGGNTTIILGALHGDEQAGFHLITQLADSLYRHPELINGKVVLAPVVNPDGLFSRSRTNSNGVDINRNFPTDNWTPVYEKKKNFPGREPASEIETQAVIGLINQYKPEKIISVHDDLYMVNYDGPAEDLANEIAKYNGYPVNQNIVYDTPGSLGTYTGRELKIAVITLELPDIGPKEAWDQNSKALIRAINF